MNATLDSITPADRAVVEAAVVYANKALGRFGNTLNHVPGDRLDMKLAPTVKSPRDLAVHVAWAHLLELQMFLAPLASDDPLAVAIHHVSPDASRETLIDLVQRSGEKVTEALLALTSENLDTVVDTPFGAPMPIRTILLTPGRHLDSHAAQIDYLQTTWDDQENHF